MKEKESQEKIKPTKLPAWKKLEVVCAEIEQQLAPDAKVVHDDRIVGKSGKKRKIDISISQSIGPNSVLIIVDCKRHAKKIQRKHVAAFQEQIEDVRAHLGVMISESGFDSGAIDVAATKGIILRTYRAAEETEWEALIGPDAWGFFTVVSVDMDVATVLVGGQLVQVGSGVPLFDKEHNFLGPIRDFWFDRWKSAESTKEIGKITLNFEIPKNTYFLERVDTRELRSVESLSVEAVLSARKYPHSLAFGSGNVYTDLNSGKVKFLNVHSEGFDWQKIIESQEGISLSPDEYRNELSAKKPMLEFDPKNMFKYLRLECTIK